MIGTLEPDKSENHGQGLNDGSMGHEVSFLVDLEKSDLATTILAGFVGPTSLAERQQ